MIDRVSSLDLVIRMGSVVEFIGVQYFSWRLDDDELDGGVRFETMRTNSSEQ